ncbi:ABC transporter substrate-binding protein [Pseudoxanthomonas sp.]|uniref:ABC transporter substrate-binding protein n=1 Tax=Pseudoxanthomonas sp. TaxID=1871049 RepID=UPI0026319A90|nr:ABC transporter substrate-binding protein [Pseudoxanthomonas sp.]WDS34774.1 MAG: ABC transporter substrate-binding protein [Pseudoxanthomonas sp.]
MRLSPCLIAGLLLSLCVAASANPGDVQRFPAPSGKATAHLRIQGSTDSEVFAAVIGDYQRLHPGTEVIYEDVIAWDMYERYLHPPAHTERADLLISASMDLQVKLVNDGNALAHRSPQTEALPSWAQWRHEAFAISYEPAAIVYNTRLLPAGRVPHTRRQLLELLRAPGAPLRGKVGTYDVARSGVGYLMATQDSELGSVSTALLAALGSSNVQLEERTGVLLDRVASGNLLLAYNVLGSYAQARIDAGAPLAIVQPEDYTLVLLRTAVIPRAAVHPVEAGNFLDYLLSPRGQRVLATEARLSPVLQQAQTDAPQRTVRPITLGPGLLVYLDTLKRRQFLETWRATVQPNAP